MPHGVRLVHYVTQDNSRTLSIAHIALRGHGLHPSARRHRQAHAAVGQDEIEWVAVPSQMADQRVDMVVDAITIGLTRLGCYIANIDLGGRRLDERLADAMYHEIGKHTGVKAARTDDDQVSLHERLDRGRVSRWIIRLKEDTPNSVACRGDARFTLYGFGVVGLRAQDYVSQGRGQHLASNREDPTGLLESALEVPRDLAHGDDEEIAETVAIELRAVVEPILEQVLHKGLYVG